MGAPARASAAPTAPMKPRALATPASPIAPAAPSVAPKSLPKAAECKTVREILPPWHVLQDKLQKGNAAAIKAATPDAEQGALEALAVQEAANAMWRPASEDSVDVPPSGVRMSEPSPEPEAQAAEAVDLSFKVYTLAELERRSDAPVSMRASRANFDSTDSSRASRGPLHLARVGSALRAFALASIEWFKTKGERPKARVALRQPFDLLGDELQRAVESVDWKKLGVTTGIIVGASLTILFAVLTAAELTDDLKPPGAAAHLATMETSPLPARTPLDTHGVAPATNMAAMGMQQQPAPVVIAPAAEPPVTTIGDIDTPTAPEEGAAAAPKKPAKRPAKPKSPKLSFRNADAVFHP